MSKVTLKYKVWELRGDIANEKYTLPKGTELAKVKIKGQPMMYYCVGKGEVSKGEYDDILGSCAIICSIDRPLKRHHKDIRMYCMQLLQKEILQVRLT